MPAHHLRRDDAAGDFERPRDTDGDLDRPRAADGDLDRAVDRLVAVDRDALELGLALTASSEAAACGLDGLYLSTASRSLTISNQQRQRPRADATATTPNNINSRNASEHGHCALHGDGRRRRFTTELLANVDLVQFLREMARVAHTQANAVLQPASGL